MVGDYNSQNSKVGSNSQPYIKAYVEENWNHIIIRKEEGQDLLICL